MVDIINSNIYVFSLSFKHGILWHPNGTAVKIL